MIDIHSKYDNMHKNGMFYALICINNHIFSCIICMLSITSLNVTSIFDILLNHLNTSIVALGNPSQGMMGRPMSIEQSMALRGAYTTVKTKLLKYKP